MKILLIVKSMMMETLGPQYLSAIIKKAGHQCRIVDLPSSYNFAVTWQPDIIGYSILTGDRDKFKNLNDRLKKVLKFKSIVGNCDPTFFPEGYGWADMTIKGEAEQQIADLLHTGQVYGDLDSIPWPARDDYPGMKVRDFIASRGCYFNTCKYCYNKRWMDLFPEYKKVRVRSAKDVCEEIKSVKPQYAYFQDSVFGMDMDWMWEFRERYKIISFPAPIPYQCHLRPEMVTRERVQLLKDSGCVAIRIALESASERLREMVGRKMSLDKVSDAVKLLKEYGIQSMVQNILTLPQSTIEDDLETLEFNIKCEPTYSWASIYVPYPGTELGDLCKENGWYKGNYSDISDSFFNKSVLEYSDEYKEQSYCLQKIFALCVELGVLPEISDLTVKNLPNFIHKAMRKVGDHRLYAGLL